MLVGGTLMADLCPHLVDFAAPHREPEVRSLGGLELSSAQLKLVGLLHQRCAHVEVLMLHGGFSGSLVLRCQAFDGRLEPRERTVVKIDQDLATILDEKEKMLAIRSLLGENAPRPMFSAQADGPEGTLGGLRIELCGACYALPGFDSDPRSVEVLTLRQVILHEAALGSKRKGPGQNGVAFGDSLQIVSEVFGGVMRAPSMLRSKMVEGEVGGCETLAQRYELRRLIDKHVLRRGETLAQMQGRKIAGVAIESLRQSEDLSVLLAHARTLLPDHYAALLPLQSGGSVLERMRALDARLESDDPSPRSWREGTVHGDLNGSNVLVDTEEVVWIIDFAFTGVDHNLKDLAKLESTVLLEYTGVEESADFTTAFELLLKLASTGCFQGSRTEVGNGASAVFKVSSSGQPRLRCTEELVERIESFATLYSRSDVVEDIKDAGRGMGQTLGSLFFTIFGAASSEAGGGRRRLRAQLCRTNAKASSEGARAMTVARLAYALRALSFRETTQNQRALALCSVLLHADALCGSLRLPPGDQTTYTRNPSVDRAEPHVQSVIQQLIFEERRYKRWLRHHLRYFIDPISRAPIDLVGETVNMSIKESEEESNARLAFVKRKERSSERSVLQDSLRSAVERLLKREREGLRRTGSVRDGKIVSCKDELRGSLLSAPNPALVDRVVTSLTCNFDHEELKRMVAPMKFPTSGVSSRESESELLDHVRHFHDEIIAGSTNSLLSHATEDVKHGRSASGPTSPPRLRRHSTQSVGSADGSSAAAARDFAHQFERFFTPSSTAEGGRGAFVLLLATGGLGKSCFLRKLALIASMTPPPPPAALVDCAVALNVADTEAQETGEAAHRRRTSSTDRELVTGFARVSKFSPVPLLIQVIELTRFLEGDEGASILDAHSHHQNKSRQRRSTRKRGADVDLLDSFIEFKLGRSSARLAFLREARSLGRLVLLLDGLDESSERCREVIISWAIAVPSRGPSLRVVLSSRPSGLALTPFASAGYRILELEPLSPRLALKIANRRLGKRSHTPAVRSEVLRRVGGHEFRELTSSPLLLSLLLFALVRQSQSGDENKGLDGDGARASTFDRRKQNSGLHGCLSRRKIFQTGIEHMLFRTDGARRSRRSASSDRAVQRSLELLKTDACLELVRRMAWEAHKARRRHINVDTARELAKILGTEAEKVLLEGMLPNLAAGRLPLYEVDFVEGAIKGVESIKAMRLSHLCFQEHLAGEWAALELRAAADKDEVPSFVDAAARAKARKARIASRGEELFSEDPPERVADWSAISLCTSMSAHKMPPPPVGGVVDAHAFECKTFFVPTFCSVCNSALLGFTQQGYSCSVCGIDVHAACRNVLPCVRQPPPPSKPPPSSMGQRLDGDAADDGDKPSSYAPMEGHFSRTADLWWQPVFVNLLDTLLDDDKTLSSPPSHRITSAEHQHDADNEDLVAFIMDALFSYERPVLRRGARVEASKRGHRTIFCPAVVSKVVYSRRRNDSSSSSSSSGDDSRAVTSCELEWLSGTMSEKTKLSKIRVVRDMGVPALLRHAARQGSDVVVRMLCERGSPGLVACAVDSIRRNTALHEAVLHSHVDVVRTLLAHGASPFSFNAHGQQPLHIARNSKDKIMVRALLPHPGDRDAMAEEREARRVRRRLRRRRCSGEQTNVDADGTAAGTDGWPVLTSLVLSGKFEQLRELLTSPHDGSSGRVSRFDVNARGSPSKMTPLMWAAHRGSATGVAVLLECGAQVHLTSRSGWDALMFAAASGEVAAVQALVAASGVSVDSRDVKTRRTPLIYAAQEGHHSVVVSLLGAKADANASESDGWRGLHWAARNGRLDVIDTLVLLGGADVNARANDGYHPVLAAVFNGHIDAAALLRRHGAAVGEVSSFNGASALMLAAANGHVAIVAWLLEECGAEIEARDEAGDAALAWAAMNGHNEAVHSLLRAKADVAPRNTHGSTPLVWAAKRGHADVVLTLIDAGADLDEAEADGWTALMWASRNDNVPVVHALLQRGSVVDNTLDPTNSYTALHTAARNGNETACRVLLAAGADPTLIDAQGNTAAALADANCHERLGALLATEARNFAHSQISEPDSATNTDAESKACRIM